MTALVIGTAGSGKSALAEELAVRTGNEKRYYLATMEVFDAAAAERVRRHRAQRAGKGFVTIEKGFDVADALEAEEDLTEAVLLLECVSNLVANEIYENPAAARFQTENGFDEDAFTDKVMGDIVRLAGRVKDLILVTNEYPKDAPGYDDGTRLYVRLLDRVNGRLADLADAAWDLRKH